jgi:hypothetical protein
MFLNVGAPEGFICFDSYILIYDTKGNIFYEKSNKLSDKSKGKLHFNLPKGIYTTDNVLTKTKLRKYNLPTLPRPEKNNKLPERIKLLIQDNPNKASISIRDNYIKLDKSIVDKGKLNFTFVLLHEIGHYFYKTESKCDAFAVNEMLKLGFNPSQIAKTSFNCLDNVTSRERIKEHFKHVVKTQ